MADDLKWQRRLERMSKLRAQQRQKEGEQEEKPLITKTSLVLMLVLAVTIDLLVIATDVLHFIPLIGNLTALFLATAIHFTAGVVFVVWFLMLGVAILSPKKAAARVATWILAFLPIPLYPGWTLAIVVTYITTKSEILQTATLKKGSVKK